jgi:hypothetical protein
MIVGGAADLHEVHRRCRCRHGGKIGLNNKKGQNEMKVQRDRELSFTAFDVQRNAERRRITVPIARL